MNPDIAFAATATRVAANTAESTNRRLRQRTQHSIERYAAAGPAAIDARLQELQREWDVERAIETEAPLMILAGVALGAAVDRRFLGLSAFAAGMLLVHSLQGWYPLLPLFRRLGLRTTREIAEEIYALKAARGDFDAVHRAGDPIQRAELAYDAAAPR
jgi:hypothetical protein